MTTAQLRDCHPFRSPEARDRYLTHYDEWAGQWPIASEARTVKTEYGDTFVRISGPIDELRAPKVPVLYAVGENERVCADVQVAAARLEALVPRLEAAVFPGAGHDLFLLQPEAVNQRVLQFLDA